MADKIHWWPDALRKMLPIKMPDLGDNTHALGLATPSEAGAGDKIIWMMGADGQVVPVKAISNDDTPPTYRIAADVVGGGAGTPGLIWQGEWDNATVYDTNDAVFWDGSSYIAIADNTNVEPGTNPAVWNILAAEGAQGPQGIQGIQGETGPQGDPGAAATITVGTTTTGAAGTDADVTNSGTSSAAVFDFVIPRGDTGTPGSTGAPGPQGDPGPSLIPTSTAASPGIPTEDDADSGIYATVSGDVGIARDGVAAVVVSNNATTIAGTVVTGTNPASTGQVRIPNNTGVYARNAANNDDVAALVVDNSNRVVLRGNVYITDNGVGVGAVAPVLVGGGDKILAAVASGDNFPAFIMERTGGSSYTNRKYSFGVGSNGTWFIQDSTAGANRLFVTTAGVFQFQVGAEINGSVGFFGTTAQSKKAVTGSRGGNAALASLLTQLAAYGLITDSTS